MPRIGLTGVTGHLGSLIARELQQSIAQSKRATAPEDFDEPIIRYIARSMPKLITSLTKGLADAPWTETIEARKVSYADDRLAAKALTGVDTLLMVSAGESPTRVQEHKAFIDAAVKAGVQHIVYISFYGADENASFLLARDHGATEEYIKNSGMTYTFIRDNFYAEFFTELVLEYGEVRGPAGDGVCSMVAREDIARVAAHVLADPRSYANETLNMTGPEELSMADVARIASEELGTHIPYIDETEDEAFASRAQYDAPDWMVAAWVSTYTAIKNGETAGLTSDVQRVTGRAPLSFLDVLRADITRKEERKEEQKEAVRA
ncbi:hypothetical protein B9G54_07685 [Alloscardovia macacae]|uniref:NmrA-like domain-containing protein n=1 Tax=Alloscardovia macacae TaxID=1160091 RepID=A0A1Y2SSI5_9BIFI|nr:SDR family oxidoreductase [Alloscardovia macacae]OTA25412.1 hypothetical protein B9G54_07685 [Alloscardovia macacae]OTA27995.1 hypothetical protein B9T39_07655 [Alloscardovia macacae]